MSIEVVFVDIDGTIVHDNEIVTSAAEAIARIQASGRTVVLCTGRSVLHTRPVQAKLGVPHMVCFNGGLSLFKGQIVDEHPLDAGVVDRIIALGVSENLPLVLHTADEALILADMPPQVMPVLAEYDFPPLKRVTPQNLRQHTVFQGNLLADASWDAQIRRLIPECFLYRWHPLGMDLQKLHCDKSVGATAILDHLGVSSLNAMHIGDGGNDVGMFRAMATSVAMGNADEDVKAEAKYVTKRVEEDGMFEICEALGLFT